MSTPIPEVNNIKLDTLYTSTWDAMLEAGAVDIIYDATPLTHFLMKSGNVKTQVGGKSLIQRLIYGKNTNTKFVSKGEQIVIEKQEIATQATYHWKHGASHMKRYWQDDQMNAGSAQIADMVEEDIMVAKAGIVDTLERIFLSATQNPLEPNSLNTIISKTPNSDTDLVGGLCGKTYPMWQNRVKASDGLAAVVLLKETANLLNTCSRGGAGDAAGNDKPNLILTSQFVYELYQQEIISMLKLAPTDETIPFPNVSYKGTSIMWSPSCDEDEKTARFLNTKYLKMVIDPTYHLKLGAWEKIPNTVNDRVAFIPLVMNLTCSNRAKQGVLTGIKAVA